MRRPFAVRLLVTAPHRLALRVFALAPPVVRRWIVRLVSPTYVVGVVLVLRCGDDVLLLDQRHDPTDWSLPGGLLERGESPREALDRELVEELGLVVPVASDQPTRTLVAVQERRIDLVFESWADEPPELQVDGVEVVEAVWRPIRAPVENPTTAAVLRSVLDG
ncbi:MAG: NUDIX hydrolase [Actinomycetes bacterium]